MKYELVVISSRCKAAVGKSLKLPPSAVLETSVVCASVAVVKNISAVLAGLDGSAKLLPKESDGCQAKILNGACWNCPSETAPRVSFGKSYNV